SREGAAALARARQHRPRQGEVDGRVRRRHARGRVRLARVGDPVHQVGEVAVARQLGVEWLKGGDGFTWESPDLDESRGRAVAAWALAADAIAGGEFELVVLEEITYPLNYGWLPLEDVLEAIRTRPPRVNVVATGRDAPEALIELADTVTEMRKVKHAFDRGIRARRGLDFWCAAGQS